MRKFFMLLAVVASTANAQDVIVKNDGSTIISKVIKIGTSEVEYKKFSNQNGPIYSILKSDILSIHYENGDNDTFTDTTQTVQQETENSNHIVEAKPAMDNAEIISRYNRVYEHGEAIKDKDKIATEGLCILGVKECSVLSTDDILIEFRQEPFVSSYRAATPCYNLMNKYKVVLYNKTDNVLYVDLGNSNRVTSNGTSYTYYDNTQTTITKGSGSGASVNIGAIAGAAGIGGAMGTLASGINVASGNSASSSKTYTKQRVLSIPPRGRVPLEEYKVVMVSSNKSETIYEGETLVCGYMKGTMPNIKRGAKFFYTENNTPYYVDYTITYSKAPEFINAYYVKASIFLRELIGAWTDGAWYNDWLRATTPLHHIEKIRRYIPDYNDYTIVGAFGYAH